MPRVSTLDKMAIATYCGVPRKISDICDKFSIGVQQAHRIMDSLIEKNIMSTRFINNEGTRCKLFVRSELETENVWYARKIDVEAPPAHDPFGLTTELSEQLRASGSKLLLNNVRRIRMEDRNEPNRKRNSDNRRRRSLEGVGVAKT